MTGVMTSVLTLIFRGFVYPISWLPMPVLHVFSDVLKFFLYSVLGYRKSVVVQNLKRCFPQYTSEQVDEVARKFYSHFCDLLMESIKTFTISKSEFLSRFQFRTPDVAQGWFARGENLTGISSHYNSWEWNALALAMELKHTTYGVYKPLANPAWDRLFFESRCRFGIQMIPIKQVRPILDRSTTGATLRPILMGLLSDQAPHDYSKAFQVQFFGEPTWVTPGPAVITLQRGFTPVWGWVRKLGRSRYEWGIDPIVLSEAQIQTAAQDQQQVERISKAHGLTAQQSAHAIALTQEFTSRLEAQIKMAPEFWLWSHRRFKLR
jgi:Kdo2-lipid IVA lauroyltransferase/acyltransferase